MTSLHVICCLGPPNQKSWLRLWAIFSLFKYNQLNRIDVRIGDGTVRITTMLTVRAVLTFKKKYRGRARNKSGGKNKNRGGAMPPAGDAPASQTFLMTSSVKSFDRKFEKTKHCNTLRISA